MATEILAGQIGEWRAASTASGGTALTTTAGYILLPKGTQHLQITPRNFATAVVAKVVLNPWLVVLKTTDAMVTAPTDYSETAQDADATSEIELDSLDTLANGDFLLIGSHLPFRGVYVGVDDSHPNDTDSTLTVDYWNGSIWTTTSATDGTAASSETFTQDGLVYWTVPTAWASEKLITLYPSVPSGPYVRDSLYWTRWSVSVALDSDTLVESMVAANRSTAYPEMLSGQTFEERVTRGFKGVGCVEALVNAGTGNLIVNVATTPGGRLG